MFYSHYLRLFSLAVVVVLGPRVSRVNADDPGPPAKPAVLESVWRKPLFPDRKEDEKVDDLTGSLVKALLAQGEPILSACSPLVVDSDPKIGKRPVIYYRDQEGICAALVITDRTLWDSPSSLSLFRMLKDIKRQTDIKSWFADWQKDAPHAALENATLGQLSSDGKRLYAIDDIALPSPPPSTKDRRWLFFLSEDIKEQIAHNRLRSFGAASGLLLWELGGTLADGETLTDARDFRLTHFLGTPLCLDGKLYFLNEKNREVRLVCLDPDKIPRRPTENDLRNAVLWIEPLYKTKGRIIDDYRRRIGGTRPVLSEGLLICPTNAGAVVGVDPAKHKIEWTYPYEDAEWKKVEDKFGAMPPLTWHWSAPVVADGRVVFAAPDADKLHCVTAKTGEVAWTMKRGAIDLFLGGVVGNHVLVLSKTHVRALSLGKGEELWRIETGLPSGTGAVSGGIYYLPLQDYRTDKDKGPAIVGIDTEKGRIISVVRTDKGSPAGNLVIAAGHLIAQSPTEIVVYPLKKTP
jgi:outer membrane protein assembly factor BamB